MVKPFLWALACLNVLHVGVHSYKIAEDCGDDRERIKEGIDSAFAMAAEAHAQLTNNPNDEIKHVFEQLFGRRIEDRGDAQLVEKKLERLAPISMLDAHVGPEVYDVTFYCTTKRIEKRKDGIYYNKEQGFAYPEGEITDRWSNCYDLLPPTIMITTNPIVDAGTGSEIQICPWYLVKLRGWKVADWNSLNKVAWGGLAKVLMDPIARRVYAPIDYYNLFDKLTHTRQSGGNRAGVSKDMDPHPYGWNDCKVLAQIFIDSGFDRSKDPQKNADSLALFGSAVKLIGNGVTIEDDGVLDPPQNTRRRDVVMYPVSWVA